MKLLAGGLLVASALLSARQGWAMLTDQPEAGALLRQLGFTPASRVGLGNAVLLGAGLTLLPPMFVGGSFLSAACILLLAVLQLHQRHAVGAAGELPFLLLALAVVYLGHPLSQA